MPLVVEDGSGIAGANSAGDEAAIKARWDDLGYDYSDATNFSDPLIAAAAIRGMEWLLGSYRKRLPGTPVEPTGIHFPATEAVDFYGATISGVPTEWFHAQCEAAFREATTPNCLTPDIVLAGSSGQIKRRKVDSIEREFFQAKSADDLKPMVTSVENILSRILTRRITTPIMAV